MSKKILSVLLTAVLLVATFCVVVPSASALTGTVYFQVPADWATDYTEVYCHYWGEDGITSPDWQSAAEVCTKVADGIYGYVLPEGNVTGLVFSVNNADKNQTADITNLDDAAGKIATIEGDTCTWVEPTTELGEVKPVETTEEPGEVTTTGSEISGTIYFEIPTDDWKNFETVYCHIWGADGELAGWQTEKEICTKVNDTLYSYEVPAGAWTNAIFSNDTGKQTGDTTLTAAEMGKVMYYTGNKVENPVTGELVDEAAWKDYTEAPAESEAPASEPESKPEPEPEKSNNIALYIIICAAVVILIIIIIVVVAKKKKK